MEELRSGFHQQLDLLRQSLTALIASVIDAIPRATGALLGGDLEGAERCERLA